MPEAIIYDAVRTPIAKYGGALARVRPDDLAAVALAAVVERTGFDPLAIDDVILGCANQAGEDARNVARMASLLAGFPVDVPAMTINRLCASGLQAVACATQAIKAGEGSCFVAGGVESMTRAPYVTLKSAASWRRAPPETADSTIGWRFTNPRLDPEWTISFGETAERIADCYQIGRDEQDAYAAESHRRAAAAVAGGLFVDEMVPVPLPRGPACESDALNDEHPRSNLSPKTLARLRPIFRSDGTVTAGNSSGLSDGAAALLVATEDAGIGMRDARPLARILGTAVAGVEPAMMGLGPIPATRKLLKRLGFRPDQLDWIELGEAFAVQAIACIRELELDPVRVNPYGGTIALGYPLGGVGARLLVTLVHALRRNAGRYGLVTMCTSVGQGIALVVERC